MDCVFVVVEGVEPTNNRAERALRFAVLWCKISQGSYVEAVTCSFNGQPPDVSWIYRIWSPECLSQELWILPCLVVVGVKDDLVEIPRLTSLARFRLKRSLTWLLARHAGPVPEASSQSRRDQEATG